MALVRISWGGVPRWVSRAARAMLKQVACAAAMSSSGLLPWACSNREGKVTVASWRTPLCVLTLPVPLRSPTHVAAAVRTISGMSAPPVRTSAPG